MRSTRVRGKALAPQARCAAIVVMIEQCGLSERRACRFTGLSRDGYRHPPEADAVTQETQKQDCRDCACAPALRATGASTICCPNFPGVNHKRVYRLYSTAKLAVRKRKKVKRPECGRVPLPLTRAVNEVWSTDFVSDSLSTGRRIKSLTVADDFSHECVDLAVDRGIPGEYVTRLLDCVTSEPTSCRKTAINSASAA